ncbi:LysR family transcriptional regulator [Bradyrhizobium brasilense]|uniref:LysR family transcriptional regulator n=1 Tax=Bradyrhizobium brasilense TaxID=1419277 RepID=UPI001E57D015|nr:LysR family transcriptional regulator [Bradyrhizobium brasilense]MCA6104109.1 LysR family transcriptional regulator [Bradyrhizobium australafricanum]MCC8969986.1 LysR family transcriptional regulator [Bradyrhizobium brasilense]
MNDWYSDLECQMASTQASAFAYQLRLKQLQLMIALGDQGSLGKAAASLNVTQPTATKMLAELEALARFKIYDRKPRGMQITELGREVLTFASRVLSEFNRMQVALDARRDGGIGELVVGAIIGAPDIIARAVTQMKQAQPLLRIKLRGESSDHVIEMLEARTVDIAVGRFNNLSQHNLYHYEPLGDEGLCVVARAGHALTKRRKLKLNDLAGERWILQSMATPVRQILEYEFGKAGMATPEDVIEVNSFLAVIQLLKRSDAVAMLSEPAIRDYLTTGLLYRLRLPIQSRMSGFGILTRRGETLTGKAAEFAAHLRAIAQSARRI